MMAVRYHGCTCHLRYSAAANQNQNSVKKGSDNSNTSGKLFLRIDNRLLRNDYVACFHRIEETYFLGWKVDSLQLSEWINVRNVKFRGF